VSLKLRGVQKIAAVLLAVDKDVAAKLMNALPSSHLEAVTEAMVELSDKRLTPNDAEPALGEYARRITGGASATNDFKELLREALGQEKAEAHLQKLQSLRERGNPFAPLELLPPHEVADVLLDENEQVCAIVLSGMRATAAARVFESFPAERRPVVMQRIARSGPPRRDLIEEIASSLLSRLAPAQPTRGRTDSRGVAAAAQILNYVSQETETAIAEALQQDEETLFKQIDEQRVTMDDLIGIDKKAMQKILASIDTRVLTVALKGATKEVEGSILENVSKRSRETILEERDLLGAISVAEVTQARMSLLNQVRALMKSGEVRIRRMGGDDVVE
jgi:flagellar motor switch protein FliG